MALTADIKAIRYGTDDGHQPLCKGLQANTTVFRGSLAALNGVGQAHQGYLKVMSTAASTDIILGLIDSAGPGTADTGPGIVGGTTDGAVLVNIQTGSFILASGTGADALGVTTNGLPVFAMNENTVGATNGSGTRAQAGIQLSCNADDPSIPAGFVAVKLGTPNAPLGGP